MFIFVEPSSCVRFKIEEWSASNKTQKNGVEIIRNVTGVHNDVTAMKDIRTGSYVMVNWYRRMYKSVISGTRGKVKNGYAS